MAGPSAFRAVSTRAAMASVTTSDAIAKANAAYQVTRQTVPYLGFSADTEKLTGPDGTPIRALMAQFTPSGRVTGHIAGATGNGCAAADYPPGTAIAVIVSGGCPSVDKTAAVRDAGVRR
jgi:N-acetylated-alpha-linked acidic dipeptidase